MKILFQLSTGLGDHVVEAGETEDIQDKRLALEFIRSGRALPAPDEVVPGPAPLTTDDIAPSPKKGGKS